MSQGIYAVRHAEHGRTRQDALVGRLFVFPWIHGDVRAQRSRTVIAEEDFMSRTRFLIAVAGLGVAVSACSTAIRTAPAPASRVVVVSDSEDRSKLRVPPGHYPPVGECRVWFPGRPPGQQPAAGPCSRLERQAPAGSWLLYRPSSDRKVVHARVIDPHRDGVVVVVRVYDVNRGTYLGQERGKSDQKAKGKNKR